CRRSRGLGWRRWEAPLNGLPPARHLTPGAAGYSQQRAANGVQLPPALQPLLATQLLQAPILAPGSGAKDLDGEPNSLRFIREGGGDRQELREGDQPPDKGGPSLWALRWGTATVTEGQYLRLPARQDSSVLGAERKGSYLQSDLPGAAKWVASPYVPLAHSP